MFFAKFICKRRKTSPKQWVIILVALLIFSLLIWITGLDLMMKEQSYSQFSYPLDVEDDEFFQIVTKYRENPLHASINPINELYSSVTFSSTYASDIECWDPKDFLILVKSAPSNFAHRDAIRKTWKNSGNSGVRTKTVFFIGNADNPLDNLAIQEEAEMNKDIVRIHYDDVYYNNTIKTVVELRYAAQLCVNFRYALLLDDDYYLSIRNLQQFTQNRAETERLYAGFSFFSKPLRHRFRNKWFISLEEYPFAYFPPYVTAGNVLLSKAALLDIYYATFFVQPFRFDDIYMSICAKKMGIVPQHSDQFEFWVNGNNEPRKDLIAGHGYPPERLMAYWKIQLDAGNV